MLARCIVGSSWELPEASRPTGWSRHAQLHVTQGSEYPIFGMGVFERHLWIMTMDDTELPNWYPADVFEFGVQEFPPHWEFVFFHDSYGSFTTWTARWGYPELVQDESHYMALVERDPAALGIFYGEVFRMREIGAQSDL